MLDRPDLSVYSNFFQLSDGKRMRCALFEPEKARGTLLDYAPGRREFIEKKYARNGYVNFFSLASV